MLKDHNIVKRVRLKFVAPRSQVKHSTTELLFIKLKGITNAAKCLQIFCPLPPLTLEIGSKGQISNLSGHGHVAFQIKRNQVCSNMVANTLPAAPSIHPPLTPALRMGSIGQNSFFSEHGHVVYQNKRNHKCGNMVANILPADPYPPHHPIRPWGWGQKVKIQLFHNMVMLHIKLK